jgi:hypothetical protein
MMLPLFLNDRNISISDADFNITGRIVETSDPLHLNAQNLIIDCYNLRNAFSLLAFCNYPGAFKGGDVVLKNITAVTSSK